MIIPYFNQSDRELMIKAPESLPGALMLFQIEKMKFCRELYKPIKSILSRSTL